MTDTDTEESRRAAETTRSMEVASNSQPMTPDSKDGKKLVQSYGKRLDALLDERQAVTDDITALKRDMRDHGLNATYLSRATASKRKRDKLNKEEHELRKAELALYFIAILEDDAVQP